MTSPLVIEPEAEAEFAEAVQWYDARHPGLGAEFARTIRAALADIERAPLRFPIVSGTTRRAVLRRFPYAIYFVIDPEQIAVIAIFHGRRDPTRWQVRR